MQGQQEVKEEVGKADANIRSESNNFLMKLMQPNIMNQEQQVAPGVQ
jgi:hypothetical protein